MEKYITQLIADLTAAIDNERPNKPDYSLLYPDHPANDPSYEGALDYMLDWEFGASYEMKELFGIDANAFPPADKLDETQMNGLITAILNLWYAYHINYAHPDPCESTTLYTMLVKQWREEKVQYVADGMITIESCDYDTTQCVWGEYCDCKKYDEAPAATDITEHIDDERWSKGMRQHPNGGITWINPSLLDENGDFDSSKLEGFSFDGDDENPS